MNRKTFWIITGIGVMIAFLLIVISNAISVGERLTVISPYLAYAFYGLVGILLYVLVINPLRVIFVAPTFAVDALAPEEKSFAVYKKASKNLRKLSYLSEEDKTRLDDANHDKAQLMATIKDLFNGAIKKEMDAIILRNGKTVMTTTAISQNGNLDMFAVILTNIRMVKELVQACGFRPSYANLAKLSVNVAVTAMIAEGLEDVNVNELMPSRFGEAVSDVPILRTATNSVFQGFSNGMLTVRIGIVTRRYLFQDNLIMTQRALRIASYKESFRLMPLLLKDGVMAVPKGLMSIMMRPFKKHQD